MRQTAASTRPTRPLRRPTTPSDLRGDPRAPVVITLLVAIVLPLVMPNEFSPGRGWGVAVVEAILLVAMLVTDPGRIDARSAKVRAVRIAMIVVLVLGAAWATGALIHDILDGGSNTNSAGKLLFVGGLVFAYIDRARVPVLGARQRRTGAPGIFQSSRPQHFAFPQPRAPISHRRGGGRCSSTTSTSGSPTRSPSAPPT